MRRTRAGLKHLIFSATRMVSLVGILIMFGSFDARVHALGLGGVQTQSYIGQRLKVSIPLYNVESPNELKIELERIDGQSMEGLTAELSRQGSQLSILIESTAAVEEPYFNFSLTLVDEGNEFQKQFTVLLDLVPSGTTLFQAKVTETADDRSFLNRSQNQLMDIQSKEQPISKVMGPYDWAEKGKIAKKFGAVLNGQSLWRVARRISPAMNVTNNQMMWALYQANPNAFARNSIESLQAGSFLTIPDVDVVASVSDKQAKEYLTRLTEAKRIQDELPVVASSKQNEITSDVDGTVVIQELDDVETELQFDNDPERKSSGFLLTGVDSRVGSDGELESVTAMQSQEIIASLSETITELGEQLGRKDRQIEVLEEQIAELQTYLSGVSIQAPDADGERASSISPSVTNGTVEANTEDSIDFDSRYIWSIVLVILALLVGFLLRARLYQIWESLNFTGSRDRVVFKPSTSVGGEDTLMPMSAEYEVPDEMDFSERSEDSFLESSLFDDSESPSQIVFEESASDEVGNGDAVPEEELDFGSRFTQLLADGQFEFARQLLDISNGQGVDQAEYHYYRLKLLAVVNDEESFYDYYYAIEDEIHEFSSVVQTKISKLVVQLAKK